MQKKLLPLIIIIVIGIFGFFVLEQPKPFENTASPNPVESHWFMLHRKSGKEFLYFGRSGDTNNSKLLREFQVKTGASWSPTPLPQLVGRDYWMVVKKESSAENPETAPYFIQLDVPTTEEWPYGPVPYEECLDQEGNNIQCDWILPGYFGLHGVNGNMSKLSTEDRGSSGCVRHTDSDITYLYNLLDPTKEEIRYYVEDI